MAKIRNEDLDQLTAEVLPERSALGLAGMAFGVAGSAVGTVESLPVAGPVAGNVVSTGMSMVGSLAV